MSIIKVTNYNSDTGSRDLGKEYTMPRDTWYLEVLSEAKRRGALLIIKTSYVSESRPGQWYIKGIKGNYNSIQETLIENEKNGLHSKRMAYLIQYS